MKTSRDVRNEFIEFFKSRGHKFVRSSTVVPMDDPTLLFINAGMNQFKPIFLGQEKPAFTRAVNTQKCIRVSGKHNDLEEVGVDDYHHTFFEMLGNWSFGDYYKKEAIQWAWELLTEVWKLDKNRLWVTIFQDDDEAGDIWETVTDISSERILKFGHKDNFWEMGETGPCGPCTEIHYYTGDLSRQTAEGVNNRHEYREIWNLVFIQYNREEDGSLTELPQKHVDTGAGFERLVAILNGETSNYETDVFRPIIDEISRVTGVNYTSENGVAHRVIADHLRMLSFSIADGAMPGNEGRGYVLRRVLRRAARFGRTLNMREPFIHSIVPTLCKVMGDAFPELVEKQPHIQKVIRAEEVSFSETLDRGLEIFEQITAGLSKGGIIQGKDAFRLYDTYGFPLDLTQLLAREKGFSVDTEGFDLSMKAQKERARKAGNFKMTMDDRQWIVVTEGESSRFVGYDQWKCLSAIRKYRIDGEKVEIVLDKTPFYAEQGGQTGDRGTIEAKGLLINVIDTRKEGEDIAHYGVVVSGKLDGIKNVVAAIHRERRQKIRLNHTATHLLHKALKLVLGDHVNQAGSLVAPDRLRFDLTHFERITRDEINRIEEIVNDNIRKNLPLKTKIMSFDDARSEGAVALFGEKYGDEVRVVDVEGFSKELCGGTHVKRTGDIGVFRIISESALAAGVRRIEAITGTAVIQYMHSQDNIVERCRQILKTTVENIPGKLESLIDEKKQLEKTLSEFRSHRQSDKVRTLVDEALMVNGNKVVIERMDDPGDLKTLGDSFRNTFKDNGVALIFTISGDKPMAMCSVTDDLTRLVKAGDVVRAVGKVMGGGGGGKPHLATAGGKDISRIETAMKTGKELITGLLS